MKTNIVGFKGIRRRQFQSPLKCAVNQKYLTALIRGVWNRRPGMLSKSAAIFGFISWLRNFNKDSLLYSSVVRKRHKYSLLCFFSQLRTPELQKVFNLPPCKISSFQIFLNDLTYGKPSSRVVPTYPQLFCNSNAGVLNRPLKCLRHASVKTMNRNAMWETCGKKITCIYMHGKPVWRKHFKGLLLRRRVMSARDDTRGRKMEKSWTSRDHVIKPCEFKAASSV